MTYAYKEKTQGFNSLRFSLRHCAFAAISYQAFFSGAAG
jgi:hypothetical protein